MKEKGKANKKSMLICFFDIGGGGGGIVHTMFVPPGQMVKHPKTFEGGHKAETFDRWSTQD